MKVGFLSFYGCLNFAINLHFLDVISVQTPNLLNVILWHRRKTFLCVNTWLISVAD